MIKQIIFMTLISCAAFSAFAESDAQIAENCKPYLMADSIAQNDPTADAALKACYDHNSCANDALLDVSQCTKKLLDWESSYDLPAVHHAQKKAMPKKSNTPKTKSATVSTPHRTNIAPVDLENNAPTHNTPQQKKSDINWF